MQQNTNIMHMGIHVILVDPSAIHTQRVMFSGSAHLIYISCIPHAFFMHFACILYEFDIKIQEILVEPSAIHTQRVMISGSAHLIYISYIPYAFFMHSAYIIYQFDIQIQDIFIRMNSHISLG